MNKYIAIGIVTFALVAGFWSWRERQAERKLTQQQMAQSAPPAILSYPVSQPKREAAGALIPPAAVPKNLDLQSDPQAEKFVRENAQTLWQVDEKALVFEKRDNGERIKVTYTQTFNGLPIFGARLSLFVEGDRLSRVQNELNTSKQVNGEFALSAQQAEEHLVKQQWQVEAAAEPMLYPVMQTLRPAYRIYATREGKAQDVIIDAVDGRTIRTVPRTHY